MNDTSRAAGHVDGLLEATSFLFRSINKTGRRRKSPDEKKFLTEMTTDYTVNNVFFFSASSFSKCCFLHTP